MAPPSSPAAPAGITPDAIASGERYANDATFRRDALVRSLVNPNNAYSQRRLALYDDDHWGALPEWNPSAAPISTSEGAPPAADAPGWAKLAIEDVPWDLEALTEVGRRAFFGYPVQLLPALSQALGSEERAARYGLWTQEGKLSATTWARLPQGNAEPALTCATCHASTENDALIEGRNNPEIDLERLAYDAYEAAGSLAPAPLHPGRVDVTDDGIDNPTAIADLRAVRWQRNLHRAATLTNGLVPLAVRIETLIITSLHETVRPPRKLAFALALYLVRLEARPTRTGDDASRRGEPLFATHCARCHSGPGMSGAAVPLDVVGTDPAVGWSPDRFTGTYRVPSLHGVGDRRRLLAGGQVDNLHEMLDPARTAAGHPFGLTLDDAARRDLLAYLETL